jgi:hypothetical protein
MQWNFKGIVDHIKGLVSVDATWAAGQDTVFKNLVQNAINTACLMFPIEELKVSAFIVYPADYSTGTLTATLGSKTLTGSGTTWTYDMKGRKISTSDGSDYYTIASATSDTITLTEVYQGTGGAGLTYKIFDNCSPMPSDVNWIRGVGLPDNRIITEEKSWDYINEIDPGLVHTGVPYIYARVGVEQLREPITSIYTAGAGTSTTSMICSSLTATQDDYYKGWVLVNVTLGKSANVTGYTASTTTLTIDEAITSQAVNNTFYLVRSVELLAVYRRFTAKYRVKLLYYKNHPTLYNDYDMPVLPVMFLNYITASVLEIHYEKDVLAQKWTNIKDKEASILKKKYGRTLSNTQKDGRFNPNFRDVSMRRQIGD